MALGFPTAVTTQSASSCSGCHNFLTMTDQTLKLGSKANPSLLACLYQGFFFHSKKKTTLMTINYHPVHSVVSVLYVRPMSAIIQKDTQQFHCPAQPPCSAYWSPHFLKPCSSLTFPYLLSVPLSRTSLKLCKWSVTFSGRWVPFS